jgi:hypothetical protein
MFDSLWFNFALEIGFLSFLGVLYYFWQKRRIIRYEENKTPIVMNFLLQACLSEKTEAAQPELDHVIEALDDYLNKKSATAPLVLLKHFAASSECPPELSHGITEGLKEIE